MSQAPSESSQTRPAFIAFLVAELGAFIFYIVISRPMWFYLDEWDFLANRTAFNFGDLFRAHNEHWVTLPIVVYRVLWWLFGLNSYRPYQVVIVLLHLTAALLVRAVMRRAGVRPWTATIVACVLVFFGSGYQNIVFPFQMTLVGSLVFGLAHLLLVTHDNPATKVAVIGPVDRRDAYGLAAGLAGLVCSGVGVSMVIAVGFSVLLVRGWRAALLHTLPLGALYLIWYAAIGHVGYDGYRAGPGQIASLVRTFVAASFRAMGHSVGVGIVLGLLLVVGLVVAWRPLDRVEFRRQAAMPLGLLVGGVVLLCITGVGRAGLATFLEKSRYLHLITALVLPALGVAADAVMRRSRVLVVPVIVVLVAGIPGNVSVIRNYMHKGIITQQVPYKAMMLSLPRVAVAKEVPRDVKPEQLLAHFVTIGWLLDGVASGRIPRPSSISNTNAAVDALRLSFRQTVAGTAPDDICYGVRTPLEFDVPVGTRIVIKAPTASIRVIPADDQFARTYPWLVVTQVGSTLTTVRPVQFHLINETAPIARVCSDASTMDAARAAGLARAAKR